ncbi:hypothetical protein AB835_02430 [Candidatus Endobugula sertula]|uniref:DUF2069 domain-containing protein n=1 Tax=Candidatus Endobugula sertula TaxID=62101 RepID=A0A1D2QT85_9GAMM|nr:hypothetical protein AB835_02430 [Candidatus Endobugula sertula]
MTISLFTPNKRLNVVLFTTYWAYTCLLLLFIYTYFTNENHSWKLLVFQSLPLLLLAPGLIKQQYRSHSWLCFAILAYFIAYVAEVGSPLGEVTDWMGLVLSVIIFISAMLASRGLQRLS